MAALLTPTWATGTWATGTWAASIWVAYPTSLLALFELVHIPYFKGESARST